MSLIRCARTDRCRWRSHFGGKEAEKAVRLKDVEDENARLKWLLAETILDLSIVEDALSTLGEK